MLGALVGLGVVAFAVSKLAESSEDYSYDDDDYYNSGEYQELIRERARQKAEEQRKTEEVQRIKKEQCKEKRRRAWGVITEKKLEASITQFN